MITTTVRIFAASFSNDASLDISLMTYHSLRVFIRIIMENGRQLFLRPTTKLKRVTASLTTACMIREIVSYGEPEADPDVIDPSTPS